MTWLAYRDPYLKAIRELTKSKSERILAVVAGALLDSALRVTLEPRLAPDKDTKRQLFKDNGPLGGQNKVGLAALLYVIDRPTAKAMTAIYTVRNPFAHNLDMSFKSDDQRMKNALADLTLHEQHTFYPHPFTIGYSSNRIERVGSERTRLTVNLKLLLILLHQDRQKHYPQSNQPTPAAIAAAQLPFRKKFMPHSTLAKPLKVPFHK
jgi:hypothetical protein